MSTKTLSRLLKKPSSFVLTSLRGSTYGTGYASPLRSLRPRWKVFLNSLRAIVRASGKEANANTHIRDRQEAGDSRWA